MSYRANIKDCKRYSFSHSANGSVEGEIIFPLQQLSATIGDYVWNESKLPVLRFTCYKTEQVKVKRHRKKRINKKWEKRYGIKYITNEISYVENYSIVKKIEDYENKTVTLKVRNIQLKDLSHNPLVGGNWSNGSFAGVFSTLSNSLSYFVEVARSILGG